jgi:hypothetical protein
VFDWPKLEDGIQLLDLTIQDIVSEVTNVRMYAYIYTTVHMYIGVQCMSEVSNLFTLFRELFCANLPVQDPPLLDDQFIRYLIGQIRPISRLSLSAILFQ